MPKRNYFEAEKKDNINGKIVSSFFDIQIVQAYSQLKIFSQSAKSQYSNLAKQLSLLKNRKSFSKYNL